MKIVRYCIYITLSIILASFCSYIKTDDTPVAEPSTKTFRYKVKKELRIPTKFNRKVKPRYPKLFVPKKIIVPKKPVIVKDAEIEALLKKNTRDLTLDELIKVKDYSKSVGNKDLAITYLERMIVLNTNEELQRLLHLEQADLYFDKAEYKKASKLYQKYVEFYPGGNKGLIGEQRDYAEYKGILCRFYARLRPPHDQSKTRKTITFANLYLNRSDIDKKHVDDVASMRDQCFKDLYDYEMDIFNQYINLHRFVAAQTRLEAIKEEFLPIMKDIEPKLLELEGLVAQKQGKDKIVAKKLDELTERFPDYKPSTLLAEMKPKKGIRAWI
ncbi:MAG: hypothetical protein AB7R69_00925 [Candidatus Babeliales bacterium]